jgi:hypothetical protein
MQDIEASLQISVSIKKPAGLVNNSAAFSTGGGGVILEFYVPETHIMGAMLVRPRPMCPRPKILGCCIPWTKCPLAIMPLTEQSHP